MAKNPETITVGISPRLNAATVEMIQVTNPTINIFNSLLSPYVPNFPRGESSLSLGYGDEFPPVSVLRCERAERIFP